MIAPIRLASTASAAPESTDLEEAQSRAQNTAADEEWELCDTDQEMVDMEALMILTTKIMLI